MFVSISPKSQDTKLSELMQAIESCTIQLPEFQRSWTWDDNRIIGLLASLSLGYPMGAIMRLAYGGTNGLRFKYRTIEGVEDNGSIPDYLILDGQQRLTSMYRATCCKTPVITTSAIDKRKIIERYYYLDIKKCLKENIDREEAVVSIPSDRKVKENFDRDITLDLSTREQEYRLEMFPINIIFDMEAREEWADGYKECHNYKSEFKERYNIFRSKVLNTITGYMLPVITLDKDTPREAVCKVFENVNTGGVPLTVFELVTAQFAAFDFDLRKDWEKCRDIIRGKNEPINSDIMNDVDETAFLTSITLFTTHRANTMTTCKKKDVLSLKIEDYLKNKDLLLEGFKMARHFLYQQFVFRKRDLPYTTLLIPLAAICAEIGKSVFSQPKTQKILTQWFWCVIMGEMYGSAPETRYANDMDDVINEIRGVESLRRTVNSAYFSATRLISLQTRNSAAYKGIMALIYKNDCRDFVLGWNITVQKSMDEAPDIHHIFPEAYCLNQGYDKEKWNSIINKTPLYPASNRQIGGKAPSEYSRAIVSRQENNISEAQYRSNVESHLVNYDSFISNDFNSFFVARAKALMKKIEEAMGKTISDKGAEQTIKVYGTSLEDNNSSDK